MDTSYQLLGILQHYAPTGSAQEACAELYREAQREGRAGRELDVVLAGALLDGLRHGNWPWTEFTVKVSSPEVPEISPIIRQVYLEMAEKFNPPLRTTGAMPAIVPCSHCDDGSDPDGPSPTGWCTRPDCDQCREFRAQTEDATCGVCRGMNSVPVRE